MAQVQDGEEKKIGGSPNTTSPLHLPSTIQAMDIMQVKRHPGSAVGVHWKASMYLWVVCSSFVLSQLQRIHLENRQSRMGAVAMMAKLAQPLEQLFKLTTYMDVSCCLTCPSYLSSVRKTCVGLFLLIALEQIPCSSTVA